MTADQSLDFRTVFEAIDIPTVVLDGDGNIVVWNERLEDLLDIPRTAVEGVGDIGEVVYDGTRTKILAEKVLERPETAAEVYGIERAESEYALLDVEGYPTYEDTSTIVGGSGADVWFLATPLFAGNELVGVVEFVQKRSDSERRRREMERLIDELVETLSAFRAGDFTARAEYDFATSIVEPENVDALQHVNDLARIRDALREQVVRTTAAKRELERRNEQLEEFASIVSHDLRNPLMVTQARLEFLREEAPDEHVDVMSRNLDRMETMIDDLLTMARAGGTVDSTEPVTLADVATEAWNHVKTDGTELVVDIPDEVAVEADRNHLLHVFENLFRNSIDHNDTPLTIRVGMLPSPDLEGFFISDDGNGIPDADRNAIFEHGYTTHQDGTGLGLSIVKDMVDAHKWSICARESADSGARFDVTGVEVIRPGDGD